MSEVSVSTQACVQALAYEHTACVHVLSLQTNPVRQMNSSMIPYPRKHLLILSTTYPCHVLLDPLNLLPPTHTCPHTCSHYFHMFHQICFIHIHIVHLQIMFSHPTHSVCPPSQCTVINEPNPSLSADGTVLGKRPLVHSLSDSQKQLPWPTKTQHKAPKWQPVRLLLL